MPQMSPLPWLSLFFMFIFLLLISNCINYFYFQPKISFNKKEFFMKKINWKW